MLAEEEKTNTQPKYKRKKGTRSPCLSFSFASPLSPSPAKKQKVSHKKIETLRTSLFFDEKENKPHLQVDLPDASKPGSSSVHIVNQDDPNCFQSIREALRQCKPYDIIEVFPGDYMNEHLCIDKDGIQIKCTNSHKKANAANLNACNFLGESEPYAENATSEMSQDEDHTKSEIVRIHGFDGLVIDIKANHIYLKDLHIVQHSEKHTAVFISQIYKGIRIEGCDICSPSGDCCLLIRIPSSHKVPPVIPLKKLNLNDPSEQKSLQNEKTNFPSDIGIWVYKCKIHHSRKTGVLIKCKSKDLDVLNKICIEQCEVYENNCSNILIEGVSHISPDYLEPKSNNDISQSILLKENCIIPAYQEEIMIFQCNIHSSQQSGIWVKDYSKVRIQGCDIHDNRLSNIVFSTFSPLTGQNLSDINSRYKCSVKDESPIIEPFRSIFIVQGNQIYRSKQNGIFIRDNIHRVWIQDNSIHHNEYPGIYIRGTSNLVMVKKNLIYNSHMGGIYCKDQCRPYIMYNRIYDNDYYGVLFEGNSQPIFQFNQVHSGISRTNVKDIKTDHVSDLKNYDKRKHIKGVMIRDNSSAYVGDNQIERLTVCVEIKGFSKPFIINNHIHSAQECGVWVKHSAKPIIKKNKIYDCNHPCLCLFGNSQPSVSQNVIHGSKQSGILISDYCHCVIEQNDIHSHRDGIKVCGAAKVNIRKNLVNSCKNFGIVIKDYSNAVVQENEVIKNGRDDIVVHVTTASAFLLSNQITEREMKK